MIGHIWVHHYAATPLEVRVDFWKIGGKAETKWWCNNMADAQTAVDCIPHPYYMYRKYYIALVCNDWPYGCTLMLKYCLGWGWLVGKMGVGLRPSDVVMSWLRLKPLWTASHIHITFLERHPYHMYTKCFSTLICVTLTVVGSRTNHWLRS